MSFKWVGNFHDYRDARRLFRRISFPIYIFAVSVRLFHASASHRFCFAPGPIWTVLQPSGGQPEEKVKNFGKNSDFGRPGQPVELAPVFVLLASTEASFINGEVYGVTGGKGVA